MFRDFIKEQIDLPDTEHKTEVVILNPSFILGPTLLNIPFSSYMMISPILLGKSEGVPDIRMAVIDVRDVAEAHYKALVTEGLDGQRIAIA